jgi:hypothetical protein
MLWLTGYFNSAARSAASAGGFLEAIRILEQMLETMDWCMYIS